MTIATTAPGTWDELVHVARSAPQATYSASSARDLPEPVRRYLTAAIAPGTTVASGVELTMRGHVKLGRWLPFHAEQVLVPTRGTMWFARIARVIRGSDRYLDRRGGMDWKAFGVFPLVHVDGDDVARSSAGRAAGESVWAPTAMLPSDAVRWSATDDSHITAAITIDDHVVRVDHLIDTEGQILTSGFQRWGDPDKTGTWAQHPFGMEVTSHRTFDGVTIPSAGRAGWHFGTDRWDEGMFFRFEITSCQPIAALHPPSR